MDQDTELSSEVRVEVETNDLKYHPTDSQTSQDPDRCSSAPNCLQVGMVIHSARFVASNQILGPVDWKRVPLHGMCRSEIPIEAFDIVYL